MKSLIYTLAMANKPDRLFGQYEDIATFWGINNIRFYALSLMWDSQPLSNEHIDKASKVTALIYFKWSPLAASPSLTPLLSDGLHLESVVRGMTTG